MAVAAVECQICQQRRPTQSPHVTIPQNDQPAIYWQGYCIEQLLLWEGQCLVLPGIELYSSYGFAFPAKTTIHELRECFIHYPCIPHSITSDQANSLHSKRLMESPGLTMFPTTLKELP